MFIENKMEVRKLRAQLSRWTRCGRLSLSMQISGARLPLTGKLSSLEKKDRIKHASGTCMGLFLTIFSSRLYGFYIAMWSIFQPLEIRNEQEFLNFPGVMRLKLPANQTFSIDDVYSREDYTIHDNRKKQLRVATSINNASEKFMCAFCKRRRTYQAVTAFC